MTNNQPHPFFELDPVDRADWVVRLCDNPRIESPFVEVPFPRLRREETPHSWLIDQFRRWGGRLGIRDRLRDVVVRLITAKSLPPDLSTPSQAVGELLRVASSCGFIDIAEQLKGWIRGDVSFDLLTSSGVTLDSTYSIASQKISLRCTVWSLLIGWHFAGEVQTYLERDLVQALKAAPAVPGHFASDRLTRGYMSLGWQGGDCSLLLFRELSRLAPESAIIKIPEVLRLPRAYWTDAIGQFVATATPPVLTSQKFHDAWAQCFGELFYDPALQPLIAADPITGMTGALTSVLHDQGLAVSIELKENSVVLSSLDPPGYVLLIDLAPQRRSESQRLAGLFNQSLNSNSEVGAYGAQEGWDQ